MERKRACGWLEQSGDKPAGIVWVRGKVSLTSCPTSYITAESTALLEEFHAWKLIGMRDVYELPARLVEAICVLENELRAERVDGQK